MSNFGVMEKITITGKVWKVDASRMGLFIDVSSPEKYCGEVIKINLHKRNCRQHPAEWLRLEEGTKVAITRTQDEKNTMYSYKVLKRVINIDDVK